MNPVETATYEFRGTLFAEYLDIPLLKNQVYEKLSYRNDDAELSEYYSDFISTNPAQKINLDEIFFENILYSNLKNIHICKLTNSSLPEIKDFEARTSTLIKQFNIGKLISTLEPSMRPSGFYLMDSLHITTLKLKFIAGFDRVYEGDYVKQARFLFAHVVPLKNGSKGYYLSGIDIDYSSKTALVMMKNISPNLAKEVNENDSDDYMGSVSAYFNFVKDKVFPLLAIVPNDSSKDDRKAMFTMCRELDGLLLKEYREESARKLGDTSISEAISMLFDRLYPTKVKPSEYESNTLKRKLEALLLSNFVNTMSDDDELVSSAKLLRLVGFPTRISFTADDTSKGATGSSGKESPISGSVMFHSLYSNFEDATELKQWSISWFADYNFSAPNNYELIPSTIYCNSGFFRVIITNRKSLDKEFIYHVVTGLSKYRSY